MEAFWQCCSGQMLRGYTVGHGDEVGAVAALSYNSSMHVHPMLGVSYVVRLPRAVRRSGEGPVRVFLGTCAVRWRFDGENGSNAEY